MTEERGFTILDEVKAVGVEVKAEVKAVGNEVGVSNSLLKEVVRLLDTEDYRKSYQKLLDLYRVGELDGSKETYACKGEVIEVNPEEPIPFFAILDSPKRLQQYHFKISCGPRTSDGFHSD